MDEQRKLCYYELLEKLLHVLVPEGFMDRDAIARVVEEICVFFNLSKLEAVFYRSLSHEMTKDGNVYSDYDNGHVGEPVLCIRSVTKTSAVIIGTAYSIDGGPPFDEEDKEKVEQILWLIISFISRKRLQNAIERVGYHDEYGYPNIRSFFRFLDRTAQNRTLEGYTAIQFNLHHFSMINKEIGRQNGDYAIRSYTDLLSSVIGEDGIVCRMMGDNFLAVFRNEVLEQVLKVLGGAAVAYDEDGVNRVLVSASAGAYKFPKGFQMKSSEEILDKLLPASMSARSEAGTSVVFYNDEMLQQRSHQMEIQRVFPRALKNSEFQVYYQPKIDVMTGEIVGAEALCRWIRDGRVVFPVEFIPILEQNTDICQLDFYMLDKVCKDIRRWTREGKKIVRVSVNFSRKHMLDPDFLENVLEIVKDNDISHDYVEIELTETTTDVRFLDLKRIVWGLQKEGICTSVDDFGMGYSSLNLIREIPWDVLKIDKSFLPVDGEASDSTTSLMFKHVVAMSRDLGLECVTEGVETYDQVKLLRENNCRIAQGFFFDKPLPVEEFEKRLENPFYKI